MEEMWWVYAEIMGINNLKPAFGRKSQESDGLQISLMGLWVELSVEIWHYYDEQLMNYWTEIKCDDQAH